MPGIVPNAVSQPLVLWQTFKETAWGTPAAATAKWMGVKPYPELKPFRKSTILDEARGSLVPGFNAVQLRKGGEFKVGGYLTYEDSPFQVGSVFGAVSPTGAGPYVYTFVGPTTTQPSLQVYTIEFNQASYSVRGTGCIGQKLTLKGEAEKWVEYELNGQAQDVDDSWAGPPTSLSDRAVTPVIMPVVALTIDASGGTIGTTSFANTIRSFSYSFENSAKIIYTGGSLTPQNFVIGNKVKVDLELELLWTTALRTYVNTNAFNNVNSLIQLKFTSGANIFLLNFAGELMEDPSLFGNVEGAQAVKLKFGAIYDTGAALFNGITVTQSVATLP